MLNKQGLIRLSIVSLLSIFTLCACAKNDSAPAILGIGLDKKSVKVGENILVTVEFNVSASDTGAPTRESDPVSILINTPSGATYVPGSSVLAIQGTRAPNANGHCANGSSYLLYDFAQGEISNAFDFKEFTDDIQFSLVLDQRADGGSVSAYISSSSPADPCANLSSDEVTLHINS